MKANELRIGNLVGYNNADYGNTPRSVSATYLPNQVGLVGVSVNFIEYNQIEPIPLIEEWILKTKFEFDVEIDGSKFYNAGRLSLRLLPDDKCAIYFDGTLFCFIDSYVHTLQNLWFAVIGEELELKED